MQRPATRRPRPRDDSRAVFANVRARDAKPPRGEWPRARALQYKMTRLWHLFRDQYPSSLKGGMVIMGRPVGPTRPPLLGFSR